jgi:hypothetical protein
MMIAGVAPARFTDGIGSNDLQDVTHACVQCGTTLTRMTRPIPGNAHAIASRL